MLVLGIESSCDETAAAVVGDDGRVLSDVVQSQVATHAPFGGIVPELASRDQAAHAQPDLHPRRPPSSSAKHGVARAGVP